jgi:hypothetical protein
MRFYGDLAGRVVVTVGSRKRAWPTQLHSAAIAFIYGGRGFRASTAEFRHRHLAVQVLSDTRKEASNRQSMGRVGAKRSSFPSHKRVAFSRRSSAIKTHDTMVLQPDPIAVQVSQELQAL